MREDELITLAGVLGILGLLGIALIALITGNIVNQLFAPIPSAAGPIGAAASLFVFVFLVGKGVKLVVG